MNTHEQAKILIKNALLLAENTSCEKVFLFVNSAQVCNTLTDIDSVHDERVVFILPKNQELPKCIKCIKTAIHTWSGNQTRFSRIKYAFMEAVLQKVIRPDSKVTCVLGPWGRDHLDTITIHDLSL